MIFPPDSSRVLRPRDGDSAGTRYYEIPIVIQDRSFDEDGSLFYPDNRAFFEGLETSNLKIPFIPDAGCTGRATCRRSGIRSSSATRSW